MSSVAVSNDWVAPKHNSFLIGFSVMLATFMEVLDTSVANVSLPFIAGNLNATVEESTWVLTSYLVANAIALPLSGWFASIFGRKRFYLTCVIIFTASSVLCGLAPNLESLVIFRILQGLGGGSLQPLSQAILVESFPPHKRGVAQAFYGMGVVFAPIIGPTLGGWITDNFSWRWIFLINIPVGMLSFGMNSKLLVDPPYQERKKFGEFKIDYIGLGLISVGLGFLQLVLDKGQGEDWLQSNFIVCTLAISLIALVTAIVWELRHKDPVVDIRLLKERNFLISVISMFMLGFMLYSSMALLPILLQTMLGYTATLSGLVLSPGGLVIIAVMPIVGISIVRFEARWLMVFGVVVTSISLFQMSWFNLNIDYNAAVWARMVQGLGTAFLFVPINTIGFHFIAKEKLNNAAGILNLARNIGGSVGIAFFATLLTRRAQFHQNILVSHLTPYDIAYQNTIAYTTKLFTDLGYTTAQAAGKAQGWVMGQLMRQANMLAFIDCFWVLGISFIAIVPLLFLMKKMPVGTGGDHAAH